MRILFTVAMFSSVSLLPPKCTALLHLKFAFIIALSFYDFNRFASHIRPLMYYYSSKELFVLY